MIPERHIKILLELNKTRLPTNQRDISKKCDMMEASVSVSMVELEKKDFVIVVPVRERGKHYQLSSKGVDVAILLDKLREKLR